MIYSGRMSLRPGRLMPPPRRASNVMICKAGFVPSARRMQVLKVTTKSKHPGPGMAPSCARRMSRKGSWDLYRGSGSQVPLLPPRSATPISAALSIGHLLHLDSLIPFSPSVPRATTLRSTSPNSSGAAAVPNTMTTQRPTRTLT